MFDGRARRTRPGGVSVRALRFYGEVGSLPPAQIDPASGYRRYTTDQLALLNRILVFKDLGSSLRAIRRLVDQETSLETMRGMLRRKREDSNAGSARSSIDWRVSREGFIVWSVEAGRVATRSS